MSFEGFLLIFESFLILILSCITIYFFYKYYLYRYKTPADIFLKARKKGRLISIDFYETGFIDFKISEDDKSFLHKGQLTHIAPESTFSNPKYLLNFIMRYISHGGSGKSIPPHFLVFKDIVEKRMKEKKITKKEAIEEVLEEQKKNGRIITEYGPLSFSNIKDFLKYDDSYENYTMAHKIASVLYRSSWKDMAKYIFLLFAGAIALIAVLFAITKLTSVVTAKPQVIIQGKDLIKQMGIEAINRTNETLINKTIIRP